MLVGICLRLLSICLRLLSRIERGAIVLCWSVGRHYETEDREDAVLFLLRNVPKDALEAGFACVACSTFIACDTLRPAADRLGLADRAVDPLLPEKGAELVHQASNYARTSLGFQSFASVVNIPE